VTATRTPDDGYDAALDLDDDIDDATEAEFDEIDDLDDPDVDPEAARAMAAELAEIRNKLARVPAAQVVANHAMGLFELAAIHLGQQPPSFSEAALAIDAMGAVVEGVGAERLGPAGPTLVDALAQIRLTFVQLRGSL
jgi:hypothetical protein